MHTTRPQADRLIAAYNHFADAAARAPRGALADKLNAFALTLALQAGNPCAAWANDAENEVRAFTDLAERQLSPRAFAALKPMILAMLDAAMVARLAAIA